MNRKDFIDILQERIEQETRFVKKLNQTYEKTDIYFSESKIPDQGILMIKSSILGVVKSCENYIKTLELILKEFKKGR